MDSMSSALTEWMLSPTMPSTMMSGSLDAFREAPWRIRIVPVEPAEPDP